MSAPVQMIGGPLDGIFVPNDDGYLSEGDIEAVNTLAYCRPDAEWSAESVYVVTNGQLVYDPEGTAKRAKLVRKYGPNA